MLLGSHPGVYSRLHRDAAAQLLPAPGRAGLGMQSREEFGIKKKKEKNLNQTGEGRSLKLLFPRDPLSRRET